MNGNDTYNDEYNETYTELTESETGQQVEQNYQSQPEGRSEKILLAISILIPLAIGGISALLTSDAMAQFNSMKKPPLAPPAWLFPVAWTILYILMGLASYLLFTTKKEDKAGKKARRKALIFYLIQLLFNFCWCILFFKSGMYLIAFIWLLVMWVLILATMVQASRVRFTATLLLVPYILWTTFAAYLNIMFAIMN